MKLYVVLVLTILVALFVLQNTEVVEIRFLFWHLTVSRVILLLGSLATGFVFGVLTTLEISRKKPAGKIPGE